MKDFVNGRQSGKTWLVEKILADRLKKNPNLVIARFKNGEMIIEKPVEQLAVKRLK